MTSGRKKTTPPIKPRPEGSLTGRKGADWAAQLMLAGAEFKNTDRVLEVACGDGVFALELARHAGYVTGVDDSDELLAAAEDRILQSGADNLSFSQINAGRLAFDDETFDAVFCQGALHRFADPGGIVREMVRVLKSPGRLYVADIIGAEDKARRQAHCKIEQARRRLPTTLFAPSGLRELIAVDSMEIVAESHWNERLGFEQWMPPSESSGSLRDKVSRMLVIAAKKKTTDLKIRISGKTITFERRWMLITAEKTGGP